MRIYRPADVIAKADQLRGGLAEGAEQVKELFELVPRLIDLAQRAEFLLDSAERAVERTEAVVGRVEALLEGVEEIAPDALPVLGEVLDAIEPDEVRALNGLVDRLPEAVEQIDRIGPDVHRILEAVTDLSQALKGVPGVDALIRRGVRKDEDGAATQLSRDLGMPPDS